MKAWLYERKLTDDAIPPLLQECDNEEEWMSYTNAGRAADERLFKDWMNFVPGSKAPCDVVGAAIQSMHNRGYDVTEAEQYLAAGLEASEKKDGAALQVLTSKINLALNRAPKIPGNSYDTYVDYQDWKQVEKATSFIEYPAYEVAAEDFEKRIYAGWWGQLIGGCLGTQLEGYTTEQIRKRFGEVRGYLRKPETYNDDITYELAYLDIFEKKGYAITSEDVAFAWLDLISDGYSAERTAIENLRRGVMPPRSGREYNYFSDWIGAQMRTMIHGMAAPGNPKLAARLAVDDSVVSHSNSGMLGGMLNAVMVSLAFVEQDIRQLLEKSIEMLPKDSEYYQVVSSTLALCKESADWENAWQICEERYKEYNWIHAYPNAAAEIVALWFGNMDFDETCHIIAMEGQDVDCTAAPVLNILAIMLGPDCITDNWKTPIGDTVLTTMRRIQKLEIAELIRWTCRCTRNAVRKAAESTVESTAESTGSL